jgi:hypothetical protein
MVLYMEEFVYQGRYAGQQYTLIEIPRVLNKAHIYSQNLGREA